MRAALLLLTIAQAGCIDTDLGFAEGPPFSCTDGACPNGYRCAHALCIAEGAADPPLEVASSALSDAAPVPLWNGARFAAVWHDTSDAATAGLHFATIDDGMLGADLRVLASVSPLTFSALYERTTARYVFAAARNDLIGSELSVVSTDGVGAPTTALAAPEKYPASPVGFSRPALASRQDGTFTLAYTRGDPPTLVSKNLFCRRVSLQNPAAAPDACGPNVSVDQFASEVSVAEFPMSTIFQWKAGATYLTFELAKGSKLKLTTTVADVVHTEKLLNANQAAGSFAVVGQFLGSDGAPTWQLRLGDSNGGVGAGAVSKFDSGDVVPDVDGDGTNGFVLCRGKPDGSAEVVVYRSVVDPATQASSLEPSGAPREIPRYSKAPIASCRIAVAKEIGAIGVLWRERVPPATGKIYFATLPFPAP